MSEISKEQFDAKFAELETESANEAPQISAPEITEEKPERFFW